jgi:hypothetical protein
MKLTTRPDQNCNFGAKCSKENCPYAHPSPVGSGQAGSDKRICRYGAKCSRPNCKYAHASPAYYLRNKVVASLVMRMEALPKLSQATAPALALLKNFQNMFRVDLKWTNDLASSLADISCKVALIFVDLDNVPRFFDQITPSMLSRLPFETFIVCSARTSRHCPIVSGGKIHFSLANATKDAADAICTVAAAKLDSILVQYGRQGDVPLIIVSDDKIFSQVTRRNDKATHACCNPSDRSLAK